MSALEATIALTKQVIFEQIKGLRIRTIILRYALLLVANVFCLRCTTIL